MRREVIFGNFRAKVVNNKDPQKYGRVLVWIPDVMPTVPDTKGIWARPANNPVGGRNLEGENDNYYMGSSYIPKKGSWVFIFFEGGNINRPYYFGALDLENTPVLPENQLGSNYQDKWTIFKSHEGRTIIVSDDPDDARVEITGKKRQLKTPPTGDTSSVYPIDNNQTTILFDERQGKEKILIRTRKGDFFHIDIDERKLQAYFEDEIHIETKSKFFLTALEDINIKSKTGNIYIQADSGEIHEKSGADMFHSSGGSINEKANVDHNASALLNVNRTAGTDITHDAAGNINEQMGLATPATDAQAATAADPKGERNT